MDADVPEARSMSKIEWPEDLRVREYPA